MARRRGTGVRSLCRASGNYYKPQCLYQPQDSYHIRGELFRALVNRADTGNRVSSRPVGVDPGYRRTAAGQHQAAACKSVHAHSPEHRVASIDERRCGQPVRRVAHGARTSKNSQRQQSSRDRSAEGGAIVLATSIAALHGHRPLASSQGPFLAARRPPSKPNGELRSNCPITARAFGLLTAMLDPPCRSTGTRPPSRRAQTPEGNTQCRARPRSPIAPRTGCSR